MVFNIKNICTAHRIFFVLRLSTIALVIAVVGLQIFYVFSVPIWRDDAFFASVAKNLANGEGYKAIFFDKNYPFHFGISSGPFIILPAAMLMFFLGNHYWVPGLANILLIWSLLISIFVLANDTVGKNKKWLFCFLSLLLTLLFSHSNDGVGKMFLWRSLMGEIPAALCIILAAFLLFLPMVKIKRLALGGLFLGFAINAKSIAAIAALVMIAIVGMKILYDKKLTYLQKIKLISVPILGVITPLFLFELVKIFYFGWTQYYDLQLENMKFYKQNSLTQNYVAWHISFLINLFKTDVPFIPVTIYILYLSYKEKPRTPPIVIGTTLIFCFFLYITWWSLLANQHSYRHLTIAICCYFAGLSLLVCGLSYKNKFQAALISFFIISLIICGLQKSLFEPQMSHLEEQLIVVEAIKKIEGQDVTMISCGNNFELEYLLPKSGNFKHCDEILKNSFDHPVMLVNQVYLGNQVLSIEYDQYYGHVQSIPESILVRCNREYLKTENFSLTWCQI